MTVARPIFKIIQRNAAMTYLQPSPPIYRRLQHPHIVCGVHITDARGEYRLDIVFFKLHQPYQMTCRSCEARASYLAGNEHSKYFAFCAICIAKVVPYWRD